MGSFGILAGRAVGLAGEGDGVAWGPVDRGATRFGAALPAEVVIASG